MYYSISLHHTKMLEFRVPSLTISIDVHGTGVSLSVVVCVCLVWVTIVRTVVTAVAHIVTVVVVLPGIVHEWTVVLFQREKDKELKVGSCHFCLGLSIYKAGVNGDEKALLFLGSVPNLMLGLVAHSAAPSELYLSVGI